jgi:hypothetical protein
VNLDTVATCLFHKQLSRPRVVLDIVLQVYRGKCQKETRAQQFSWNLT